MSASHVGEEVPPGWCDRDGCTPKNPCEQHSWDYIAQRMGVDLSGQSGRSS